MSGTLILVTITYGSQPGTGGDMGDILHVLHGRDTIESAAAYRLLGWPVAIGHRQRTGSGCTCQTDPAAPPCLTPGAHPVGDTAVPLEHGDLTGAFEAAPGAGVIVPCTHFEALVVAHAIGMGVMLRADATNLHIPCLTAGHTTATLLVEPGTGRLLADCPQVDVRSGPQSWVAMPPSYGIRWDTAPDDELPLPPAQAVRPHLTQVLKLSLAARAQG
ncbi:hypothetical protein GCM10010371_69220 [Streptomyces subrutilus]|uniref:Uncharacterized protein n=1 Tax=Streptomyces subrutilus TaxID=36818 RepID=A0A918VGR0_9ACTN|nr:hypothetical protein GCM10010371_69220 [Streptomyces subrutilus]